MTNTLGLVLTLITVLILFIWLYLLSRIILDIKTVDDKKSPTLLKRRIRYFWSMTILGIVVFFFLWFFATRYSLTFDKNEGIIFFKVAPNADFSDQNLSNEDFRFAILTSANFKNAKLINSKFKKANLSGSHLEGAILKEANFEEANLSGSHLEGAILKGANFEKANLSGSHLEGAVFEGAVFERANLQGVNLQGVNLQGVNLQGANLQGVNLQRANFQGVNLQGVNLQGINLQGANFQGVNLQGINLQGANLQGANLQGSSLTTENLNLASTLCNTILPNGETSYRNCPNLKYTVGVYGLLNTTNAEKFIQVQSFLREQGYSVRGTLLEERPVWLSYNSKVFYYSSKSKGIANEIKQKVSAIVHQNIESQQNDQDSSVGVPRGQEEFFIYVHII